ncbi:uncharacterized protein MONOS_13490 [Monocercomonoides exilis]|uniref:uncharacterized protein n=1 Tax=Monocercomonoides exilis TaxID=2049356 RepID=UPI003559DA79|nr:hypothetical protein MONOS_13490 [Monocercomonoides exilis]|eukprot:MONOS_13490.1-p1 / transcript=MONOS_13490.1 / gene=MONOS_13490 / organism=Monocercomonoides_exilis_PA203 / gene_product=unspecified product / transcript_product=unspecified product / location=Mono_scaffold00836:8323-10599(-) / protein_length=577 / sequence_SO=supercontig / SO=protein_coding / is_pseudo=false
MKQCFFDRSKAENDGSGGAVAIGITSSLFIQSCTFSHCAADGAGGGGCTATSGGGLYFQIKDGSQETAKHEIQKTFFDKCSIACGTGHDAFISDVAGLVGDLFLNCSSRTNYPDEVRVFLECTESHPKNEWIPTVDHGPAGSTSVEGEESTTGINIATKNLMIIGKYDESSNAVFVIPEMVIDKYFFNVSMRKLELLKFDVSVPGATSSMVLLCGTGELVMKNQNINGKSTVKYTNSLITAASGKISMESVTITEMRPDRMRIPLISLNNVVASLMMCDFETGADEAFVESDGEGEEFLCSYKTGVVEVAGDSTTIDRCTIKFNSLIGLKVVGTQVFIKDSDITDNTVRYETNILNRNVACTSGGSINYQASDSSFLQKVQHWVNDRCTISGNITNVDSPLIKPTIRQLTCKPESKISRVEVLFIGTDFISCAIRIEGKCESELDEAYRVADSMTFTETESVEAILNLITRQKVSAFKKSSSINSTSSKSNEDSASDKKTVIAIRMKYLIIPNLSGGSIWDTSEVESTVATTFIVEDDDPNHPKPDSKDPKTKSPKKGVIIGATLGNIKKVKKKLK